MRFPTFPTIVLVLTLALAACGAPPPEAAPVEAPEAEAPEAEAPETETQEEVEAPEPEAPKASVYVFSNASPHITEIDAETNEVVRTADVPGLKQWGWIDDNNYFDGVNLWVGIIDFDPEESIMSRDPDTGGDSTILLINLDTLTVTEEISVGPEKFWLYIGKPTEDGRLFVGKHGAQQMAIIDIDSREVLEIVDVPVPTPDEEGSLFWATCDADVSIGPDGVERVFYPTWNGNTVVSLDSSTGETLKIADTPDTGPVMLSTAPDGTVWAQESGTNTNAVFNPVTLDLLARFSTGKFPSLASFSPDGQLGYITGGDTMVTVVDAENYRVLRTVEVGANAGKAAAHPNGELLYVMVSEENSVAVIDTSTWEVIERIDIGTSPTGLFIRTRVGS